MGAKKRRQEDSSAASAGQELPPSEVFRGNQFIGTPGDIPGDNSAVINSTNEVNQNNNQCSSCCNTSFNSYTDENNNVIGEKCKEELIREERKDDDDNDDTGEKKKVSTSHKDSASSTNLFSHAWRKLVGSSGRRKKNKVDLLVVGLLAILASSSLVYYPVESVCVWQGGGGFKVACGFRQSGLFRIRTLGGIKGYIGGGFTIGDEDGFKDSLTNTEGQQAAQQQHGVYAIPSNVNTQRSLPGSGLPIGQYSAIQEHPLPIPTGDPAAQKQQKLQYLNNIQHQLDSDHKELQLQAIDQQSQKQLEQQMYIQGGILPPTPTAKVKRAETGGLTKRASLWNWNLFGRGKNGKNNNAKKKPNKNGPPQQGPQNRRGGPPPHMPMGKRGKQQAGNNNGGSWIRRGKNGPPPRREKQRGPGGPPPPGPPGPPPGGRLRGLAFPKSPNELKNMAENFLGHMKNPFSHLQENFMGKSNSKEVRKLTNFHQQKNSNFPITAQRKQFNMQDHPGPAFPSFVPPLFPPASMEKMSRHHVPQQSMLPPPPSHSEPMDIPKFKKLPNNQKAQDRNDDYIEEDEGPPPPPPMMDHHRQQEQHQEQDAGIDRMMPGDSDDYPNPPPPHEFYRTGASHEAPQFPDINDPAGLKMLKQTQNFGTIFHLVNPDGSPVNMQFEKEPIIPPGVQLSPHEQQELVDELASYGFPAQEQSPQLPSPNAANDLDLLGLGHLDMDSPLATAVYDPNVFPDIYFTTTEKHKNALGADFPRSQELLDNQNILLGQNHLKRILGSSEKSDRSTAVRNEFVKQVVEQQKSGAVLRSSEISTTGDEQEQIVLVPTITRKKVRRRKKFRNQMNNQIDTNESDATGSDVSTSTPSPKRRRKGRRKKKYKLATTPKNNNKERMATSTERMGLAAMDGGEQSSNEHLTKTESSRIDPLTTTPAPQKQALVGNRLDSGKPKTSFSLPSSEDFMTEPSAENKINTSGQTTSKVDDSTTRMPISYSTFGYIDALRHRQGNPDDYDFSGPEGPDDLYRGGYDPRFPPDHERNRGHNMTKFIRPRGQGATSTTLPETTNMPFILYDMVGTRNQSRFSSKFHKDVSPFKLDSDLEQNQGNDVRRNGGDHYGNENSNGNQYHPFYANSNIYNQQNGHSEDKGVYMKFDSQEWGNGEHQKKSGSYYKDTSSDPFSNHYNRTSTNSGFYSQGGSKEYGPSAELPWHRRYDGGMGSTTSVPTPAYPAGFGSSEVKSKFFKNPSSSSLEHGLFGPTMETFGLPKQTTKLPYSDNSDEKRKLHKTLFGGSSADVSDLGDWASPNFWGNLQDTGRYSPSSDFESQNNGMKRVMEHDQSNGLREMSPSDLSLSNPTPIPAPSLSQSTMEDLLDDILAPSHPGGKWGKQRRRKQKQSATASPATTPTPTAVPPVKSTAYVTSIPVSSTTQAPAKWLAISSNEIGLSEFGLASSIEMEKRGKKKSGIEVKFKSGEERDPEEEAGGQNNEQDENFQAANATNKMGYHESYPGVTVHDYDSPHGYEYGENTKSEHYPHYQQQHHDNNRDRDRDRNHHQQQQQQHYPDPHNHHHLQQQHQHQDHHLHHEHHPSQNPPRGGHSSEHSYYSPGSGGVGGGNSGHGAGKSEVNRYPPIIQYDLGHKQHQHAPTSGPSSHNHDREPSYIPKKEFNPSAEDLGPLPQPGKGLPSHQDNPFKQLEKQDLSANGPVTGFVSAKHELDEMVNQISKFVPDEFLRRDSSEKLKSGGSALPGGMNGRPDFPSKPGGSSPPLNSDLNIPGFVNIPLPSIESSPAELPMKNNPISPLEFGPSGFPNNLRDSESGPPTGPEGYSKDMKGDGRDQTSGPPTAHSPPSFMNAPPDSPPWDIRPLDNNEVNDPTHGRHEERHPPPRRPHDFEDEMRRPPPPHHERERPPHMSEGLHRPPLSHIRHPNHRDEHEGHNRPPPPNRPHPNDRPMRPGPPPPPPPRDHERPPPHGRHEFSHPPRGPPGPPEHHDRRPPPPDFEREFSPPRRDESGPPPRHGPPEDRFRDGPPPIRGHPPPPPPPRGQDSRPPHNDDKFYPPRKEESHRFDQDRKNFHNNHNIEHLRPPPHGPPPHDRGHDHNGDHSNHGNWRDEKPPMNHGDREPHHRPPQQPPPPPPHGPHAPLDFKDVKILPHHPDHRPPLGKSPKSHNPFLQKPPPPPPPPPGKKHLPPNAYAKIPPQIFKPPPPPPSKQGNNHKQFHNEVHGNGILVPPPPKSRQSQGPPPHLPPPPPPPKSRPLPPGPLHSPTRKPSVPIHPEPQGSHYHDSPPPRDRNLPHNNHNNYINSYNDRYDPPPPNHGQERVPSKNHLRPPPPLPPMHPHPDQTGGGSRLPYLPFPVPGGGSYETSVIDLDQDPHAHLLPHQMGDSQKLTPPKLTQPVYRPQAHKMRLTADAKMDEKSKLLDAFETLNKANYDVIQSLAAEKYGPDLIDRVKTKSNIMKPDSKPLPFPLKVEPMPVVTSTTTRPVANVLAVLSTKQPSVQDETAKLAELLKMINKQQPSAQPLASGSSMPQKNNPDPLSSFLNKLTSTKATAPPTTTPPPPPRRLPEMPSNPGLLSLTSALNPGPTHDVKSLQAQIAKAIIAKAHQKSHNEVLQQPPPQQPSLQSSESSPLQVLQQLAQSRQSTGRNYTASQIETLKKLIALNNIEQKLNQPPTHPPPPPTTTEDPLKKLQALLPAAISAAQAKQKQQMPSNTISRKMLDTSTAQNLAHRHNSNLLQKLNSPDPTLLALKAIALSKAQGVHPQPTISLPQQAKPTEPSSQPIAVDLSAILSPSPPVVEASRKRRLTNVRNAPKSFYPANATQGFEDFAFPLLTEFHCDDQNFFPGLYADTELGCRVFHLCAKTEAGYMMKSFRCPKETVFDQEVLRCNWNLFVDCPKSRNKYHFNKYLSQSFQFLKILGEFSANYQKSDATMTG